MFLNVVHLKEKHNVVEDEADTEAGCDEGCPSSLDLLQSVFPDDSVEELNELLMLCNGDVKSVIEMLTLDQL